MSFMWNRNIKVMGLAVFLLAGFFIMGCFPSFTDREDQKMIDRIVGEYTGQVVMVFDKYDLTIKMTFDSEFAGKTEQNNACGEIGYVNVAKGLGTKGCPGTGIGAVFILASLKAEGLTKAADFSMVYTYHSYSSGFTSNRSYTTPEGQFYTKKGSVSAKTDFVEVDMGEKGKAAFVLESAIGGNLKGKLYFINEDGKRAKEDMGSWYVDKK